MKWNYQQSKERLRKDCGNIRIEGTISNGCNQWWFGREGNQYDYYRPWDDDRGREECFVDEQGEMIEKEGGRGREREGGREE